jgi:two-component system, NtrC family, sensor kinase
MGKLMPHEDAPGSRAVPGDPPPASARAPAPPGLRSAVQASLEQAEARYTPPGPASARIEAPTVALDRDAVDAVLQLVPWPALAIDEAGEVIRCSDELQAAEPAPFARTQSLRARWALYRQVLSGSPPWLASQTVETTRHGDGGQILQERLILRRTAWGACLFVIDQTDLRALQTSNLQTARLAALGFMIAGVSHELSNPLTAVYSVVQLLRSKPPSEEVLRKGLDSIGGNIQRILEMSRRLLTFSRLCDEPRTPFAISLAIDEALSGARADGLFERIKVTVRHDPGAEVRGNIGQLRQVFSNLLLNAAQAMEGTGQIDVRTVRTKDGHVDVAVVDGGPGIGPAVAPKIFEAFFTTKPSGGGTGLGLAISQQILSEHGGRLWFENNRDGGASFHVQLPQVNR